MTEVNSNATPMQTSFNIPVERIPMPESFSSEEDATHLYIPTSPRERWSEPLCSPDSRCRRPSTARFGRTSSWPPLPRQTRSIGRGGRANNGKKKGASPFFELAREFKRKFVERLNVYCATPAAYFLQAGTP